MEEAKNSILHASNKKKTKLKAGSTPDLLKSTASKQHNDDQMLSNNDLTE